MITFGGTTSVIVCQWVYVPLYFDRYKSNCVPLTIYQFRLSFMIPIHPLLNEFPNNHKSIFIFLQTDPFPLKRGGIKNHLFLLLVGCNYYCLRFKAISLPTGPLHPRCAVILTSQIDL